MRGTMKADKYTRCASKLQAHAGPKKECISGALVLPSRGVAPKDM
jgi:hypothetical protein